MILRYTASTAVVRYSCVTCGEERRGGSLGKRRVEERGRQLCLFFHPRNNPEPAAAVVLYPFFLYIA